MQVLAYAIELVFVLILPVLISQPLHQLGSYLTCEHLYLLCGKGPNAVFVQVVKHSFAGSSFEFSLVLVIKNLHEMIFKADFLSAVFKAYIHSFLPIIFFNL